MCCLWFFVKCTATTESYTYVHTLSLHDARPIYYVGIVRTTKRLQRALHRVQTLASEIQEYYGNYRVGADLIELRNLVVCADLIIRSALERQESRGLHYTLDYPQTDAQAVPTVLPGRG